MSIISGFKKGSSLAFAYIPYAIALGLLANKVGISPHIIFLMSLIIYAGNSEIIILTLFSRATNIFDLIIPAVIVNIRYILINLPVIRNQNKENIKMKILSSLLLTDEAVVYLSAKRIFNVETTFGFGFITYLSFVIFTLLGALLGDLIPEIYSSSLGFVLYAILLSLLIDTLRSNVIYIYTFIFTIIIKLICMYIGLSSSLSILISIILGTSISVIIKTKLNR